MQHWLHSVAPVLLRLRDPGPSPGPHDNWKALGEKIAFIRLHPSSEPSREFLGAVCIAPVCYSFSYSCWHLKIYCFALVFSTLADELLIAFYYWLADYLIWGFFMPALTQAAWKWAPPCFGLVSFAYVIGFPLFNEKQGKPFPSSSGLFSPITSILLFYLF